MFNHAESTPLSIPSTPTPFVFSFCSIYESQSTNLNMHEIYLSLVLLNLDNFYFKLPFCQYGKSLGQFMLFLLLPEVQSQLCGGSGLFSHPSTQISAKHSMIDPLSNKILQFKIFLRYSHFSPLTPSPIVSHLDFFNTHWPSILAHSQSNSQTTA